ncbi:hypothetical protein GCM10011363_33210 [Marivita lacus]|uniref:DUF3618 domain-containing protein n=1 Tax=Marivita lacus TaxID=1323742 RepID=A0ABQ1KY30_9RHOB|nr:hypothetical protein [Marivita lacus]GGC13998.1 hypothetical protein GCM10011363_33210 [Marivita lacus]
MSTNPKALHAASESSPDMAHDARMRLAASARDQAETARQRTVGTEEAETAGQDSHPDTLQDAALAQLGAQINVIAARFQDTSVDEMVDDVAVFARRNPLLFLGGAALAGFAAARFLKSGGGSQTSEEDAFDPWSGHLQPSKEAQQ